jgi:hypothetical protein
LAPRIRITNAGTRAAVERALSWAERLLTRPECRRIFSDFQDQEGRDLQAVLEARGQGGADALQWLLFYDGSGHAACAPRAVYAVTQPGSRVVLVCGQRFQRLAERNPREAATILIHEQLHSLGLGENPPLSTQITWRVRQRCFAKGAD